MKIDDQELTPSTPTGGTCPNDFFRSNRPGYPHPVSSELENSGIRVAVGDCSVTERRRWRPPYQTGKTVHVHAKHYKHNEDGRTAPGVCGNGSVPLSHSGNVVTRIGIHTHTHTHTQELIQSNLTSKWSKEIGHQTCNTETSLKEQLNEAIHICLWLIFYILLSIDSLQSDTCCVYPKCK